MSTAIVQDAGLTPAGPRDGSRIDAFLVRHAAETMFLRSNLREFGPCGGDAPHASRMWMREQAGAVTGVVGLSTAGVLLVALSDLADLSTLRGILDGQAIIGGLGAPAQLLGVIRALGLDRAPVRRNQEEPLYSLDLDRLKVPEGETTLRMARMHDSAPLARWRQDFLEHLFQMPRDEAKTQATVDVARLIERERLAVLEQDSVPMSVTAFNAVLPDMVQIGNVYTPPDLRGCGFARRAVALHLDRVRAEGVTRAILSASGRPAARAYEAIGFRQVGHISTRMFDGPQIVGGAA